MAEGHHQSDPPAISLRESMLSEDRETRPWTFRLVLFLRLLAIGELFKALTHWAGLIGGGGGADPFAGRSAGWLIATIFFAVADPVAAVGLWLGAAWGVVIWLIAALAQLSVIAASGLPFAARLALVFLIAGLMSVYLALSLYARRETS